MNTNFKVVNIVAVMNCGFPVRLSEVWKAPELVTVYDECNIYTIVKPKGTTRNVTVFRNGNMITVGNKKVIEAKRNLEATKRFLFKFKLREQR